MKYELKNNGKCWWVKGMIVEGEIKEELMKDEED